VNPPVLSVVVVVVSDTVSRSAGLAPLARCLEALEQQIDAPETEVIVPHLPRDEEREQLDHLAHRFPRVRFLAVHDIPPSVSASREHHDALRARGLAAARGEIVALLEDHARPDPRWCGRVVEAHRSPHAAIGGAIDNDVDRPLNWAVYFCDFYRYLNPVRAGVTDVASDANVSYKRRSLEAIRPIWDGSFHEPAVNAALAERGETMALSPDIVVVQHREELRPVEALKERFVWGRSYAAARGATATRMRRVFLAALSPALPLLLTARMARTVADRGRLGRAFLRALPWTLLLTTSWSLGELTGYGAGRSMARTDTRQVKRGRTP
jgi:hypothetical protein